MIKAVLFDMDGLIFDTEHLYKTSWQFAANEQGLDLTDALYQHFIGVPDAACEQMLLQHFGSDADLSRFQQHRDRHFHHLRQQGIAYKSGFAELFNHLRQKQMRCALVTSSALAEVKHNFEGSDYLKQFERIVTAEDVDKGKPDPECYLLACQRLLLSPEYCLVLEDSNNGMQAALDAGCQAVMIPDLLMPSTEVKRRASYIFEQLEQVIAVL
ncbi:HAD family hydrolase [Agarivorans sp. MS3-6]